MTQVFLTRHGQTVWNKERRLQGNLNSDLTDLGIEQAHLLKERIVEIAFDAVYSSPKDRALKTAQIATGQKGKIKIMEDLREMTFGKWEGILFSELEELLGERFTNLFQAPHKYVPDEGETYEEVTARAVASIEQIVAKHPNETVLVVAHGVTVKSILAHYEGRKLEDFWKEPIIHQASLSLIEFDTVPQIKMYGDTSHLKTDDGVSI